MRSLWLLVLFAACRSVAPPRPPPPDLEVFARGADGAETSLGLLGPVSPAGTQWFVRPVEPALAAAELVRALAGRRVPGLSLRAWPSTLEGLAAVCTLEGLTWLDLSSTELDRARATALRGCASLHTLVARHASLDDEALASLPPLQGLDALDTALTDRAAPTLARWPLEALTLSKTRVGDEVARALSTVATLRRLSLANTRLTGAGLTALAPLTELRQLDLGSTAIDDDALATLARFPQLEALSLSSTAMSDLGARHLRGLTHLTVLDLSDTRVTDDGLAGVEQATALEALVLDHTTVGDATARRLGGLRRLRVLGLSDTLVTSEATPVIGQLTALEALDLEGAPLTTRALDVIVRFTALRSLDLGGALLLDARLERLPALQELRLADTQLTAAQVQRLDVRALRVLDLSRLALGDDTARWLAAHAPRLELLKLNFTSVGDDGLRALAQVSTLQRLDLGKTAVTDAGLGALAKHPALRSLDLGLCAVGRGVGALTDLPLESLGLAGTAVDDEVVARLPRTLRALGLMKTQVSPAAVKTLEGFPRLREVDLRSLGFEEADVAPLLRADVSVSR